MGVNVYGWRFGHSECISKVISLAFYNLEFFCRSSGVNHVLIFELDPRNHLSEQHLMELAAILGVIWALSVLTFLYSEYLAIPAYACPLALVAVMTVFMLNPTRTFRYEARFWMLRVLGRILCAPFFYVKFPDFWVADQLNSLSTAFTDAHYFICFYASNATDDGKDILAKSKRICPDGIALKVFKNVRIASVRRLR